MKYLSVHFKISGQDGNTITDTPLLQTVKDILCEYAGEAGFESFEDDCHGVIGYVQEQLFDKDVLDMNISQMPVQGISVSYKTDRIDDENWNKKWEEEGFAPIVIKDKCIIHDTLHNVVTDNNDCLDITIDTQQAFGTGTHETTSMIIEELLNINLQNKSVLDCGCGTGILSIVSSKSGANTVLAYDMDEWSVKNTEHNCELNNVTNVRILLGNADVLNNINSKFDVVLANINRNILLADMPQFVKTMKAGALLLLSGFYVQDANSLINMAESLGLTLTGKSERNTWCMLKFSK